MKISKIFKCLIGIGILSFLMPYWISLNQNSYIVFYKQTNKSNLNTKNEIIWGISDQGEAYPTNKSDVGENVTVPSRINDKKVIGITASAFESCNNLKSIHLPAACDYINDRAFKNCTNLETIFYESALQASGIRYLGTEAFANCVKLKSIKFKEAWAAIGQKSFENCSALTDVYTCWSYSELNTNVHVLQEAFLNCRQTITFHYTIRNGDSPDQVLSKYKELFTNKISPGKINFERIDDLFWNINDFAVICPKTGMTIPSNLTIPNSVIDEYGRNIDVRKISDQAFYESNTLKSVTFSDGSENIEIGSQAFSNCSNLASVTLSNSLDSINSEAFSNCVALKTISIPNKIVVIREGAFSGCTNLSSITFEEDSNLQFIDSNSFKNCTSLKSITIPKNIPVIREATFAGCTSLTNILLPGSLQSIENQAFYGCTNLASILFPNSLNSIGVQAFSGCTNLTNILLPSLLRGIGDQAFANCTNLESVVFNANSQFSFDLGSKCFFGDTKLKYITFSWSTLRFITFRPNAFDSQSPITNIYIHQDINFSDRQSTSNLIKDYQTKLTSAGLTSNPKYETWYDSHSVSPTQNISFFNLDNVQIITNINNGFKAWKDQATTRKIAIEYTVENSNIHASGEFNSDFSSITTTLSSSIPNIDQTPINIIPKLVLTDSANAFSKTVELDPINVILNDNKNYLINKAFTKNSIIDNNRNGLWISGDSYSINIDINKAYFGQNWNNPTEIKNNFDKFINVVGLTKYSFNHLQSNIYYNYQIGQMEVLINEVDNATYHLTLNFTLPDSTNYSLQTQTIHFYFNTLSTTFEAFNINTISGNELDPQYAELSNESSNVVNLNKDNNRQANAIYYAKNKIAFSNIPANSFQWAKTKGYFFKLINNKNINPLIKIDDYANFDVQSNTLLVSVKQIVATKQDQSFMVENLRLQIVDLNGNVYENVVLAPFKVNISASEQKAGFGKDVIYTTNTDDKTSLRNEYDNAQFNLSLSSVLLNNDKDLINLINVHFNYEAKEWKWKLVSFSQSFYKFVTTNLDNEYELIYYRNGSNNLDSDLNPLINFTFKLTQNFNNDKPSNIIFGLNTVSHPWIKIKTNESIAPIHVNPTIGELIVKYLPIILPVGAGVIVLLIGSIILIRRYIFNQYVKNKYLSSNKNKRGFKI